MYYYSPFSDIWVISCIRPNVKQNNYRYFRVQTWAKEWRTPLGSLDACTVLQSKTQNNPQPEGKEVLGKRTLAHDEGPLIGDPFPVIDWLPLSQASVEAILTQRISFWYVFPWSKHARGRWDHSPQILHCVDPRDLTNLRDMRLWPRIGFPQHGWLLGCSFQATNTGINQTNCQANLSHNENLAR